MSDQRVILAHTADLGADLLAASRVLLDAVFPDLTAADWEHCLGGLHAVVLDRGSEVIGHAALVQRRLLHGGRALRAGYVEGIAVRADRRRRGHGNAMMNELERVLRAAYEVGALGATDDAVPFYSARGWQRWCGPTATLSPLGLRPTPEDDGAVYVLPVAAALDLSGELSCDWRDGDVW